MKLADIMSLAAVRNLRERYGVPSLLFLRSVEKARSPGDLFDILDTFPPGFPVKWDGRQRRWVTVLSKQ